jgi:hypothetical protein
MKPNDKKKNISPTCVHLLIEIYRVLSKKDRRRFLAIPRPDDPFPAVYIDFVFFTKKRYPRGDIVSIA